VEAPDETHWPEQETADASTEKPTGACYVGIKDLIEIAGIHHRSRMSKSSINAAGETAKTIAPVQASPMNDAEFCDSPGAFVRFGLRRSLLYDLWTQGLIKGVSLRRRGAVRGKRLWSIDSIRSYLREQMEAAK
jgi:hypothetical protein